MFILNTPTLDEGRNAAPTDHSTPKISLCREEAMIEQAPILIPVPFDMMNWMPFPEKRLFVSSQSSSQVLGQIIISKYQQILLPYKEPISWNYHAVGEALAHDYPINSLGFFSTQRWM